jgi:hypothetical protein
LDYIGARREMEDKNSILVASPVGQNESRLLRKKLEPTRDELTSDWNDLHNELINFVEPKSS